MLTVSRAIQAGQGEYYLALAGVEDYYASGSEPPGFWLGRGALALELKGELQRDQFRNLLLGLSPDGSRKLVRNADHERRAGWDLTWSAPKSVSVAWSQADEAVRERIERCLRRAVHAGVSYLEAVGGISRRGVDGCIHESADLIFAAFLHSTSRALDPQLHLHTLLINVGVRRDGTTGTLEPKWIYRHQMAAGALFRAELAHLLEVELGLRSRREGRSFELLGVDAELMAHFSKRRAAIEAELARTGQTGARAAEVANFVTRERKEPIRRDALFASWQQIGREHHWSAKELGWLIGARFAPRDRVAERAAAMREGLAHLTTHESHFSRRQIVQSIAECCQGRSLNAATVLQLVAEITRSPELVALGEHRGERQFTTREILALERRIFARAEAMVRREVCRMTGAESAAASHPTLSAEQRRALERVGRHSGGLSLIEGLAGTGKSTLFAVAREVWAEQGRSVYGAALAGKAARGLEQATGIPSTTVHRLLSALRSGRIALDESSVVLVDEASMVGTRQLSEIFAACARSGASLVLCGDPRQLQAVELGGVFHELCRRFDSVSLTEIRRQREPWARRAVAAFADGNVEAGLLPYQQRGLVCAPGNHWQAVERLLADWMKQPAVERQNLAILAATVGEVSELNRQVQEVQRRQLTDLTDPGTMVSGQRIYCADRVLFTRNLPSLGVCNGDLGTVDSIVGTRVGIRLDDGRTIGVDAEGFAHLRLGYALTTHKAQGTTVEASYILAGGPVTNRELAYVQASRARGLTRWYLESDLPVALRRMERSMVKRAAVSLVEGPRLELSLVR